MVVLSGKLSPVMFTVTFFKDSSSALYTNPYMVLLPPGVGVCLGVIVGNGGNVGYIVEMVVVFDGIGAGDDVTVGDGVTTGVARRWCRNNKKIDITHLHGDAAIRVSPIS